MWGWSKGLQKAVCVLNQHLVHGIGSPTVRLHGSKKQKAEIGLVLLPITPNDKTPLGDATMIPLNWTTQTLGAPHVSESTSKEVGHHTSGMIDPNY